MVKEIDNSLINEMLDYANKGRAEAIYYECLKRGHVSIAKKIFDKYGLRKLFQSDLVMAFGMALQAKQIYDAKKI